MPTAPLDELDLSSSDHLEDIATAELSHQFTSDVDDIGAPHGAYVLISSGNKSFQQHKSSVCHIYSRLLTVAELQTRLERIHAHPWYNEHPKLPTLGVEAGNSTEPVIEGYDPACLLFCSKELIWLAVVQILDIKQNGTKVKWLAAQLLSEPNV
jgi:hypothetical protein